MTPDTTPRAEAIALAKAWRPANDTAGVTSITRGALRTLCDAVLSAPDSDGVALRRLRSEMQAAWLACIENKKRFDVGSPDRRECQAEANAFQSACFRIDRELAARQDTPPCTTSSDSSDKSSASSSSTATSPMNQHPSSSPVDAAAGSARSDGTTDPTREPDGDDLDRRSEGYLDTETNGKTWAEIIKIFAEREKKPRAELAALSAAKPAPTSERVAELREILLSNTLNSRFHRPALDELCELASRVAEPAGDGALRKAAKDVAWNAFWNGKRWCVTEDKLNALHEALAANGGEHDEAKELREKLARAVEERDWERRVWPEEIGKALGLSPDDTGRTPSMMRMAVSKQLAASRAETEAARAEARKLAVEALDRDKTGLAAALNAIIKEVDGRLWVTDGRGCYEWDDDRYRAEAGLALRSVKDLAHAALVASGNLARAALESQAEPKPAADAAEREGDAVLREFLSYAHDNSKDSKLDEGLLALVELCRRALAQRGGR